MKFIQRQRHWIVLVWVLFLLVFYTCISYQAISQLYENRVYSSRLHRQKLDPHATEENKTQVDFSKLAAPDGKLKKVSVGIYVDRIVEISTKATDWTVDFYLWFNWRGNSFDPGKDFQVIDGEILSKTKDESDTVGDKHYALYRVTARITKFFNIVRYPLDNHLLTIRIEDQQHTWKRLQYVPDIDGAAYSSRVEVPGYALSDAKLISKPHAYKTSRGDPRLPNDSQAVYSQLTYGIAIERRDCGLYIKTFQGLFASVAIAFLAFVLGPLSGERISLGVGAFFASVASGYLNMSELPGVGMVTMVDVVNGFGMVTIFLTLLASVISARLAKHTEQIPTAVLFDRISLLVFAACFVVFNLTAAIVAAS
jgi:hypothetical protein